MVGLQRDIIQRESLCSTIQIPEKIILLAESSYSRKTILFCPKNRNNVVSTSSDFLKSMSFGATECQPRIMIA